MSTVHRRILPAKESRCSPSPDCPLQRCCARFTCPLPLGIGATLSNFRNLVMYTPTGATCGQFVSEMVSDAELEEQAKKPVKPPIGKTA